MAKVAAERAGKGCDERTRPEVALFEHRKLRVAEQVALYARAAVVIGVHGAGFANALWAPAASDIVYGSIGRQ